MKKIAASFTGTLAVLILFFIFFYGCRRDFEQFGQDNNKDLDVTSARSYYRKLVKAEGNQVPAKFSSQNTIFTSKNSSDKNQGFNKKYLVWKSAYRSETDKFSFVEVPLYYNQKISSILRPGDGNPVSMTATEKKIYNSSLNRLIIYKDKATNAIGQYIANYIPDSAYLQDHNYDISQNHIDKLDKDFTGYIKYSSWDGEPKALYKLKNGKTVSRGTYKMEIRDPNNARIAKQLDNNATARQDCYTVTDYLIVSTCYYPDAEDPSVYLCSETEFDFSYDVCSYIPDDGGPVTYNDPCFNPANFSTPACDPPGGSGSGSGSGSGGGGSGSGVCYYTYTSNLNAAEFICKQVFVFTTTINAPASGAGGWQVAAVDDIHITITDGGANKVLTLPKIFIGLPVVRTNGTLVDGYLAQSYAAAAVEDAETKVMQQFQASGAPLDVSTMMPYYLQKINDYLTTNCEGNASTSGSPALDTRTAFYSASCSNCQ